MKKQDNTTLIILAATAIAIYFYFKNKPANTPVVVSSDGKITSDKSFMNLPVNPSDYKAKFALGKIPNTI